MNFTTDFWTPILKGTHGVDQKEGIPLRKYASKCLFGIFDLFYMYCIKICLSLHKS
uniref:Uncharacterized protein n=1 Tax=Rhizophagus irregularis (strain DAOM 181602 / DAOM 197198 / MUCL 43194) TaxID=747089 RepID=U9UNN5_RHIID